MSPWMRKKVKPKGSAPSSADHLLLCNYSPSFDHLRALITEKRKSLLELKESLNEK